MIHLEMRIASDTLSLPELREFIGKDVEVIILEKITPEPVSTVPFPDSASKSTTKEIARDQGKKFGGWPEDERNDGFEEWMAISRKYEILSEKLKREAAKHLFGGATQ